MKEIICYFEARIGLSGFKEAFEEFKIFLKKGNRRLMEECGIWM